MLIRLDSIVHSHNSTNPSPSPFLVTRYYYYHFPWKKIRMERSRRRSALVVLPSLDVPAKLLAQHDHDNPMSKQVKLAESNSTLLLALEPVPVACKEAEWA
jgi:hypothetical protein